MTTMPTNDNPDSVAQGVRDRDRDEEWRYIAIARPWVAYRDVSGRVLTCLRQRHPRLQSWLVKPEQLTETSQDLSVVKIGVGAMIEGQPVSGNYSLSVREVGPIRDLDAMIDDIAKQLVREMAEHVLLGKGVTSEPE